MRKRNSSGNHDGHKNEWKTGALFSDVPKIKRLLGNPLCNHTDNDGKISPAIISGDLNEQFIRATVDYRADVTRGSNTQDVSRKYQFDNKQTESHIPTATAFQT